MKKVSYEDYVRLNIASRTPDGFFTPLERFFDAAGGSLSAIEILQIEEIYAPDRLNIVLREEFLNTTTLYEFGLSCAEVLLQRIDEDSVHPFRNAIRLKRAWMSGGASLSDIADVMPEPPCTSYEDCLLRDILFPNPRPSVLSLCLAVLVSRGCDSALSRIEALEDIIAEFEDEVPAKINNILVFDGDFFEAGDIVRFVLKEGDPILATIDSILAPPRNGKESIYIKLKEFPNLSVPFKGIVSLIKLVPNERGPN